MELSLDEALLSHLLYIDEDQDFRSKAYPVGEYVDQAEWVKSRGIRRQLGHKDSNSNAYKRLKALVKKGDISSDLGRPVKSKRELYFQITDQGKSNIKATYGRLMSSNIIVNNHAIREKKKFSQLLGDIQTRLDEPALLVLWSAVRRSPCPIKLEELFNILGIAEQVGPVPKRNPIVGIRPFGEDEGDVLFGMDEILRKVGDSVGKNHWAVLMGPSGSGKTSMIKAGLIGKAPDDSRTYVYIDTDRLGELRHQILDKLHEQESILERLPPKDFIEVVLERRRGTELVIIIDGFERMVSRLDSKEEVAFRDFINNTLGRPGVHFLLSLKDEGSSATAFHQWKDRVMSAAYDPYGPRQEPEIVPYKVNKEVYRAILMQMVKDGTLPLGQRDMDAIVEELSALHGESGQYGLVYLQMVLRKLEKSVRFEKGLVRSWVEEATGEMLVKRFLSDPLKREILSYAAQAMTKGPLRFNDIAERIGMNPGLNDYDHDLIKDALDELVGAYILERRGSDQDGSWRVVHDFIGGVIDKQLSEEEMERRRVVDYFENMYEVWRQTDNDSDLLGSYGLDWLPKLTDKGLDEDKWRFVWLSVGRSRHALPEETSIGEKGIMVLLELLRTHPMSKDVVDILVRAAEMGLRKMREENRRALIDKAIAHFGGYPIEAQIGVLDMVSRLTSHLSAESTLKLINVLRAPETDVEVKRKTIALLARFDLEALLPLLHSDEVGPLHKLEIIKIIGKSGGAQHVRELLPFLRPDIWEPGPLRTGAGLQASRIHNTMVSYSRWLTSRTAEALTGIVDASATSDLIVLLEDEEVDRLDVIRLLGETKDALAVPALIGHVSVSKAKVEMKSGLGRFLSVHGTVLREIGQQSELDKVISEWDSLSEEQIVIRLRVVSRSLSEAWHRDGRGSIDPLLWCMVNEIWECMAMNDAYLVHDVLLALAKIGGKEGTRAFLEVIHLSLGGQYWLGEYYSSPHEFILQCLNDIEPSTCRLDREICLSLLTTLMSDEQPFTVLGPIEDIIRFMFTNDCQFLSRLESMIIEEEKPMAAQVLRKVFCLSAVGTMPKTRLRFVLEMPPSGFRSLRHFYENTDWSHFKDDIFPLLNDEELTRVHGGSVWCSLIEIFRWVDTSKADPYELANFMLAHLREKELEDLAPKLAQAIRGAGDFASLVDALLRDCKGDRPELQDAVFALAERLVLGYADDMARLLEQMGRDRLMDMIDWSLDRGHCFIGISLLTRLEGVQAVTRAEVVDRLSKEKAWNAITQNLAFLSHRDDLFPVLTDLLRGKGVNLLLSSVVRERRELLYDCLPLIEAAAVPGDFAALLPYAIEGEKGWRDDVARILLKIDLDRAFSLLVTRALVASGVMYAEWPSDGISLEEQRRALLNDFEDRRGAVLEKLRGVFHERLRASDITIALDSEQMFQATFPVMREAIYCNNELAFDTEKAALVAFEEIMNRDDPSWLSLLKRLYDVLPEFVLSNSGKLLGPQTVQAIRRFDDGEWVCYWLLEHLGKDDGMGQEALAAILDHDMDILFLAFYRGRYQDAREVLERAIKRMPDKERKAKRILRAVDDEEEKAKKVRFLF